MNEYINYIIKLLNGCDVYLVFDRYNEYSLNCVTRCGRAGKASNEKTQDNPNHALTMQQILLSCTGNKFQLIDIICEQVIKKT